jgi:hypothetical protein
MSILSPAIYLCAVLKAASQRANRLDGDLFQFVATSSLNQIRWIIQTLDPPNASRNGLLIVRPNILSLV